MSQYVKHQPTLCWNCEKAIGNCNWSRDLEPVKGWTIVPTKHKDYRGEFSSCIVLECPEFKQDAEMNGLKRLSKEEKNKPKNS